MQSGGCRRPLFTSCCVRKITAAKINIEENRGTRIAQLKEEGHQDSEVSRRGGRPRFPGGACHDGRAPRRKRSKHLPTAKKNSRKKRPMGTIEARFKTDSDGMEEEDITGMWRIHRRGLY